MIKVPCKAVFRYRTNVIGFYESRSGQTVTVLYPVALPPDDDNPNLYHVLFADGKDGAAYEDELTAVEDDNDQGSM